MTRGHDIQTVVREGKRIRTVHLEARVLASPLIHSRIGIIVPRHRHSAVKRNRVKRRLRELVRVELLPSLRTVSAAHLDIALRVQPSAYEATFEELRRDVLSIMRRVTGSADAP